MVEIVDPNEAAAVEGYMMPVLLIVLLLVVGVVLRVMWWFKHSHEETLTAMKPMERFIEELTKASSPGHDKALFGMLPTEVMSVVEKGTIRAMGRCVLHELGTFLGIDPISFRVAHQRDPKSDRVVFQATGSCRFSKSERYNKVVVSWFNTSAMKDAQILGFQFSPPAENGQPLNVTNHVDPKEFEEYGVKFVTSLMTKSPSWAHKVMLPGLSKKYETPEKLSEEVMKILRAVGGFKGAVPEITLTGTTMFEIGAATATTDKKAKEEEEGGIKGGGDMGEMVGHTPKGITLQFHIAGRTRDMSAEIRLVFVGLQTRVARYELRSAKGLNEKMMVVDQDTGVKTMME